MITCIFQDKTKITFHGSSKTFHKLSVDWHNMLNYVTPTPWCHPKRQVNFRLDLVVTMWRE